jgi:hypothetical protein
MAHRSSLVVSTLKIGGHSLQGLPHCAHIATQVEDVMRGSPGCQEQQEKKQVND